MMIRFNGVRRVLLLGVLLLLSGEASAQSVRAYLSVDSVSVGERFRLTFAVENNGVARVLFPDPALGDSILGDLEVLQVLGRGTSGRKDSVVYEVTTFALDSARVPPIPVRLAVESGRLAHAAQS